MTATTKEIATPALTWAYAAPGSQDLIAAYLCDFTQATDYRFTPKGTLASVPTTVTGATGVVIDNMLNGTILQVQVGLVTEVCPAYQKIFIALRGTNSPDVVIYGSAGTVPTYFFTGAFLGNTENINTFAAYQAGVVASSTNGSLPAYFATLRWMTNLNLASGYNLDNLTDSGHFDVLNPISPSSGNLPNGTWQIEARTYSSSNLYTYQLARNILSPDTEVYERRQLAGNGWTAWRNIGLPVTGQCQFQYVSATQCKLAPMNGGALTINGNVEQVPAGLTIANAIGQTALAASTLYYCYAFMTGQAMALEWSTTAFALDARGCPIKNGDATRTCVGMAYTNASGQFTDTPIARNVATYFNRTARALYYDSGSGSSTSSTSMVTMTTISALSWGTDATTLTGFGYAYNSSGAGYNCYTDIVISGARSGISAGTSPGSGYAMPLTVEMSSVANIGYCPMVLEISVGSGTGSFIMKLAGESLQ